MNPFGGYWHHSYSSSLLLPTASSQAKRPPCKDPDITMHMFVATELGTAPAGATSSAMAPLRSFLVAQGCSHAAAPAICLPYAGLYDRTVLQGACSASNYCTAMSKHTQSSSSSRSWVSALGCGSQQQQASCMSGI